jgi:ATP-dependent helicase/nuclease subunit A
VDLGPVPAVASPLSDDADRFRRGRLIHTLLQYLPDLPADRRQVAARAWLDRPGHDLPAGEAERIAAELAAILDHPDLIQLFGTGGRAEVSLSGLVGDKVVGGLVDRLAVLPDRVLVADFKTNRRAPASAADTPVMYLRQMAAYRAVLRQIFPDRPVQCTLVWTHAAQITPLPDALLDAHTPG